MVFPSLLLAPIHCSGEEKAREGIRASVLGNLSFGLWCGSELQAQGVGVRGSSAFSSQGSRVCLLQESEKALLVLLFFFFSLRADLKGKPSFPTGMAVGVQAVSWDPGTPLPRGPMEGESTWGGGTFTLQGHTTLPLF